MANARSVAQSEWKIMGVPSSTVSNMAKFESADPGYWCRKGYAVANVDPRGIGHSEGDFIQFGTQDGRDGYDFIEWIAEQDWCNSRVGLSGQQLRSHDPVAHRGRTAAASGMHRALGRHVRYVP